MSDAEGLTVGDLADASGVTVRTLHHYDRIGLLTPSGRTAAGHRRYADEDVRVLYRIVALRQLGLSLSHIGAVLSQHEPIVDLLRRQIEETTRSIQAHHELLARLQRGVAAADLPVDVLLDVIGGTAALTPDEVSGPLRPQDADAASVYSMLFEGLDGAHTFMRQRLAALDANPSGTPWLFRAVSFEDRYVMAVLQAKPTVFDDQGWSERLGVSELPPGPELISSVKPAAVGEYGESVFAATTAYVTTITDDELNRDIPGPGASALTWSMKVSELLAQVAAALFQCAGYVDALSAA